MRELVVFARHPSRVEGQAAALGGSGAVRLEELSAPAVRPVLGPASVVVLAANGAGLSLVTASLAAGVPVVSVSDDPAEVRSLLGLHDAAVGHGLALAVGAGMAPGLSCLLAAWAARTLDEMSEVHVATLGTGRPGMRQTQACGFAGAARGVGATGPGSAGCQLGPGAGLVPWSDRRRLLPGEQAGCLAAQRAAFPTLSWATTRAAASRRDRLTSWLPMLRRPHPEGTVGAVRVEVRGRRSQAAESVLVGATGRPALLAGAVAAAVAVRAAAGQLTAGAGGLASLVPSPGDLLAELSQRGVKIMTFERAGPLPAW